MLSRANGDQGELGGDVLLIICYSYKGTMDNPQQVLLHITSRGSKVTRFTSQSNGHPGTLGKLEGQPTLLLLPSTAPSANQRTARVDQFPGGRPRARP